MEETAVQISRTPRMIVALIALSAATACTRTMMAGGEVDLSMATPAELGPEEQARLRQMSDANILGHLMTIDSLQIAMADTALYHVKTGPVNSYAKMMHLSHEDDRKALRDLAGATGLIPTIDVTKLRSSRIAAGMDSIRKTSDVTKDQLYVRTQIDMHSNTLAELQVLQGVARNTALLQHVSNTIPVVRDHLARAQAMAPTLGISRRPK